MADYVVGQVYEYLPGQWGKYNGGGIFQGVEDPNKQAKILEHKKALGDLYYKLYNGDKSVLPEIQRLSNLGVGGTTYGMADTSGNRDQLDELINAGFIGNANGYKTKINEARVFADVAIEQAKIYSAELAKVNGDTSLVSAAGLTARAEMLKALKKEASIIGGGYNDHNEEAITMLANNLASGNFKPNSYNVSSEPRTQKQPNKALTPSWIPVAPTASTTQSTTTKQVSSPTQKQYNPLATRTQGYIATQKAPAATKQTPQTMTSTISGYTPSATKSRMSQAIQQPTYNQTDITALKQKDWVIKKII